MIRIFALSSSAILLILMQACYKKCDFPATLELTHNEWNHGAGIKMKLQGEILDSRCPINELMDIDCVWQGVAEGMTVAKIGNNTHEIPFSIMGLCDTTTDTCGNTLDTLGYHFQFISLNPYPDGNLQTSDYVLTVRVEKK